MGNFNQVQIMGNLTRDPELRYTPSGAAVCEFTVAVNRRWKSQGGEAREEVTFVDVTAWGRTAEIVSEYMKKGRGIFVAGRLTQDRWEDKNTGQKRSKLKVTAENVQFLGGGKGNGRPAAESEETASAGAEEDPLENYPF